MFVAQRALAACARDALKRPNNLVARGSVGGVRRCREMRQMEKSMNKRLPWILSAVALVVCAELGRSVLRPYDVAAQTSAQEAVIAPAENLVEEGMPGIPASLVETAGRYGSYPRAALTGVDARGRGRLSARRVAGSARWV